MITTLARFALLLLLSLCLLSSSVYANGMRSHIFISTEALKTLPDGPVKSLLSSKESQDRLFNGSYFPDSGYAAQDGYGEIAHWEPCLEQYIQYIRKTFQPPYDKGDAAHHVAFLLGMASHGMADQGFDTLMMAKSREVDKANMDEFDTANDVFLVKDKMPPPPPEIWAPVSDFVTIFRTLGHGVTEDLMNKGMQRARLAQISVGLVAEGNYERMKQKYPWYGNEYLNPTEPGSLLWLAPVIARYWRVLWRRVNGETKADKDAVLITVPANQATGISTDHRSINTMITVLFGFSMVKQTLTAEHIKVTDTAGQEVAYSFSNWGAQKWANTLKLRPKAALKPGETYTVTLGTGIKTINGTAFVEPYRFQFTTATGQAEPTPIEPIPVLEPIPDKGQTPAPDLPVGEKNTQDTNPTGGGCETGLKGPEGFVWIFLMSLIPCFLKRQRNSQKTEI